jgi:hypothetical protein
MHHSIDLGAPHRGVGVEGSQINRLAGQRRFSQQRDREVVLGVAAQVFYDALRLRIRSVAKVRDEPVMGGEPYLIRCRDNNIGDYTTFQTAHPVSQDLGRNAADGLEGFGDHRQRGGGFLIGGEPHEPPPRIGQDCAEHQQSWCGLGPVHHQIVTW